MYSRHDQQRQVPLCAQVTTKDMTSSKTRLAVIVTMKVSNKSFKDGGCSFMLDVTNI